MLASVYSYRVMVKSASFCCVRGRRVLSNPVTYFLNYNISNILVPITVQVSTISTGYHGRYCTELLYSKTLRLKIFMLISDSRIKILRLHWTIITIHNNKLIFETAVRSTKTVSYYS